MNSIQSKKIVSLFANTEISDLIIDIIDDMNSVETVNQFNEYINRLISEQEICYYSNAINFLQVHDPSLRTSLGLAYELGYSIKEVNSELLATILLQSSLQKEFDDAQNELEAIFSASEIESIEDLQTVLIDEFYYQSVEVIETSLYFEIIINKESDNGALFDRSKLTLQDIYEHYKESEAL